MNLILRITILLILVSLLALSNSCQAGEFFIEIGFGLKLQATKFKDDKYQSYNNYIGPTTHVAAGYRFMVFNRHSNRIELNHESNIFLGIPFNNKKEFHLTEARYVYRYSF